MADPLYLLIILTGIIAAYASFLYMKNRKFWAMVDKFKGDSTLPIIGNAHQFGSNSTDILKSLLRMWENSGKGTFKLQLGQNVFIMLCQPEDIEILLSNNYEIQKLEDYQFFSRWLGDGLLLSSGNKWRRQRKIITPTFHFKILEQFLGVFEEKGEIFIKKLTENKGKVFDVYPYVTHYALDVICESAMGTNLNAQENSNSEYVRAVYSLSEVLHHRTFSFWKRIESLYLLTSDYQKEKKFLATIHGMSRSVIESRKKELNTVQNNAKKENEDDDLMLSKKVAFLDMLLMSKTPEGESLSDQIVQEEVDTFMFEGHDTTASGIAFALYSLANNPHVQNLAFEEQLAMFGNDMTRKPTYGDLQEMTYLDRVIKETLRLYPSVPFYGRKLQQDLKLTDGKIIPAGAFATLQIFCMSRDPKYFTEPYKFDPDRFLPENKEIKSPFAHVPFSAGPRNCIGQKFAMLEMKSTLSKVLRNFELESGGPGTDLELAAEVILKSKTGIQIKLKDRVYL